MVKRIILSISVLFLFGCTQQNEDQSLPDQKSSDRFIQVENANEREEATLTNTEIANHLVDVANSVTDVNQSAAIVLGPYAVVGLNVDKDLDRSRVGAVKYSVLEALQKDPYGKTTVVVADGDIVERIREMNNKVQQGYPVQGVIEELAAIVGRYMPEFPVPEQMPTEEDQNKELLPEEDKEELDNIQDDQSNDELNR